MAPRVLVISPAPLDSPQGNATTVARIALALGARGLDVRVRDVGADGLGERTAGSRPALIHAFHAYRTGPLGLSLAKTLGVPLVITLTGTDVSYHLRDPEHAPAVREVLRAATAVTAFHDSIASEVAAVLPEIAPRLAVVPQSVHFPSAGPNLPVQKIHGDPCVLFPAGIRPVKRPLLPLAPLEGLLGRYPGLRLWYAGPALDQDEAQRLEREIAGRHWARYLGAVPHVAMPSLLPAADIVLNCSLSEGGMANAVLEAFAFGRAVLASDIPGNRSVVEDGVTGLLFGSEAELADKAARLAGDPALRSRLGDAGRRLVASLYTLTRETDGYLDVYARAAGGRLA